MPKFITFVKLLASPDKMIRPLSKYGLLNWMSDEMFVKIEYKATFGKNLNLDKPETFNEKLQWLKLYDHNPYYTALVDKYKVREYISNKIGEEYLIPLLGVWDCADDIDFDLLPDQFVLKCNHDQGSVIVCRDKTQLDIKKTKRLLNHRLKKNHYYTLREWPYKNVSRKIICEKYMEDTESQKIFDYKENKAKLKELKDYKFFCFDGKVKLFKIDYDRFIHHRANYYDGTDKSLLYFGEEAYPPDFDRQIDIPANIDDMISLAEKLSKGFPFLRVDFYSVQNRIYFGELTFFPASGFGRFDPPEWDEKIGGWLELPGIN